MTYTTVLSSRLVNIVSKTFEVTNDRLTCTLGDCVDTTDYKTNVKVEGFTLKFRAFVHACEHDEDVEDCLCHEDPSKWQKYVFLYFKNLQIIEIKSDKDFASALEALTDTVYTVCVCGDNVYKENMCARCYIYAEVKEDDRCCICLENENECWGTFSGCNHSVHLRCYINIPHDCSSDCLFKKCPLCRQVSKITFPEEPEYY